MNALSSPCKTGLDKRFFPMIVKGYIKMALERYQKEVSIANRKK